MSFNQAKSTARTNQTLNRAEIVRALTPMFMTFVGGLIGVFAIMAGGDDAAFGLAGTAIAGAAGLSQTHESKPQQIEETIAESELKNNTLGAKK